MQKLLALGTLLFAPLPAPQDPWYDPLRDYAALPPLPAERHAALAAFDLPAAQALAVRATGGLVQEAHVVLGDDPRCEVELYTASERVKVVTDPRGTQVREQESIARFPGWPMEGDWVELPSGLKYYDVEVGQGKEPRNAICLATTEFDGWLMDGTLFQTTSERGKPITAPLSGGIPGWREGLLSMKVGGRRKLLVPPELAYGAAGQSCLIPPNATLLFDVHLVRVKP